VQDRPGMLKFLFCLIWGHATLIKLETVVHPTRSCDDLELHAPDLPHLLMARLLRGGTTVSLLCPRCGKVKVFEQ
jgi:hypothetical protein